MMVVRLVAFYQHSDVGGVVSVDGRKVSVDGRIVEWTGLMYW